MSVLVVVEASNGTLKKTAMEAVTYAHRIAISEGKPLLGLSMQALSSPQSLGTYGVAEVLHVSHAPESLDAREVAHNIAEAAYARDIDTIVCAHTSNAKNFASYLSVVWDADLVSGATALPSEADGLISRSVFAGKASVTIKLQGVRRIITVAGNSIPVQENPVEVQVSDYGWKSVDKRTEFVSREQVEGIVPLPEAELVVSGGRGLKGPENWGILLELADALGATTACSRPVADSGWRPHHEHVGQTGVAIRPNLYVAVGISGAIQHLGGVNNSKTIVVINNDSEAPFFKAADYGVCGDLFEVVPRLTEAIRKYKQGD